MGREDFSITVVTPKRTLTHEILDEFYKGYEDGYSPGDARLEHVESIGNGLVKFYIDDVYEDDPARKVVEKYDIATSMEITAVTDGPGYHLMYTPTTSSVEPGSWNEVTVDYYAEDYVPMKSLRKILDLYKKDPANMTPEECKKLMESLNKLVTDYARDPHDILKTYTFETDLGRDQDKTKEIDEVLSLLDRGIITEHEAMEEIKAIKER